MGVRLTWTDNNAGEDGHRVYRSTSPMDPEDLPEPIATLGPDVTLYDDGDVTEGQTYYYRVSAFSGDAESVSEEVSILVEEPEGDIIGVVLVNGSVEGGDLVHIDEAGNTITTPGAAWFDNALPWAGMVDEVIDGQHMVRIPRFYYRRGIVSGGEHDGRQAWWLSPTPAPGFEVHPAFVLDGSEVNQFWYGKYQGSLDAQNKLASVPGVVPTTSRSWSQFLADAEARNVEGVSGFRMHHIDMLSAIQWLALIESATFDSQAAFGEGRTSSSSPAAVDAPDTAEASYRGIIGAWGNIWMRCDGLRHVSGDIQRRTYTGAWLSTGQSRPSTAAHYPASLMTAASVEDLFIAATTASLGAAVLVPDYHAWLNTGERYAHVCGGSPAGYPGLWSLGVSAAATGTSTGYGSRLARVV